MSTYWTDHENLVIISCIEQYRSDITGKSTNTIRAITKEYVNNLIDKQNLNNRTEQAVYEHLSYFDDLLAGVGTPKNYAKKDSKHFSTLTRSDNNTNHNPARVMRNATYRKAVDNVGY
jgi:hypothetical protein